MEDVLRLVEIADVPAKKRGPYQKRDKAEA
jgi:hypothetical protein